MSRTSSRSGAAAFLAACLALAACASTAKVTALQSAPIAASPRTVSLDLDERLPFDMTSGAVTGAMERAGFSVRGDRARYRLVLAAMTAPSSMGGYLPPADAGPPTQWVARPDRGLRARLTGGALLRVTVVLVDASSNHEVWRGSGMLRTDDPRAAAPGLVQRIMEKLPRG